MSKNTFLTILILLSPIFAFSNEIYRGSSNEIINDASPILTIQHQTSHGKTLKEKTMDLTSRQKVIVQFYDAPLAQFTVNQRGSKKNQLEIQHSQFRTEVAQLQEKLASKHKDSRMSEITIQKEFYTAFNGAALDIPAMAAYDIHRLPSVKRVWKSQKFKINLMESVPLIRAPQAWEQYDVDGEGIVVGILDTGIDYNHPDLGGGFGPEFKVIGGYDIVMEDEYPMDENGHGTWVAGIVAANGDTIKGVAPNVSLMAFRVFDQNGGGYDYWVIEGIERALDPDGNPETDDAVDILNMSFGGAGDPDDPVSLAVDNATAAGALCVVAAGNSGYSNNGYRNIESPGCARQALTVGSTNDVEDIVYESSSRGPTVGTHAIKPDVVAPGGIITAPQLGGGYRSGTGTSAAAPHVAGVAALLMQLHPDWSPRQIKSAIMQGATQIENGDIFIVGSGRLDALNTLEVSSIIQPASISFGLVDRSIPIWINTNTICITNFSDTEKTYTIDFLNDNMPSGTEITISQEEITLSPNEIDSIIVEVSVDNSIVPTSDEYPCDYKGLFQISSNDESYRLPTAFIKSAEAFISVEYPLEDFIIHNNTTIDPDTSYFYQWYWGRNNPTGQYQLLIPKGTYDFISYGRNNPVTFLENIFIDSVSTITLSAGNIQHDVLIQPVTENGDTEIIHRDATRELYMKNIDSKFIWSWIGEQSVNQLNISDVTDDYQWRWHWESWDILNKFERKYRYKILDGIYADTTLTNIPDDLHHLRLNYYTPGYVESIHQKYISNGTGSPMGGWGVYYNYNDWADEFHEVRELYIYNSVEELNFDTWDWHMIGISNNGYRHTITSPFYFTQGDTTISAFWDRTYYRENDTNIPDQLYSTISENIHIGLPPIHWFPVFQNTPEQIRLINPKGNSSNHFLFAFQDFSFTDVNDQIEYNLYAYPEDYLISNASFDSLPTWWYYSDDLGSKFNSDYAYVDVFEPMAYRLEVPFEGLYSLGSQMGNACANLIFDTSLEDPNPPSMFKLWITSDDEMTYFISQDMENSMIFTLDDNESQIDSVSVWYQVLNEENWLPLEFTFAGTNEYTVDLNSILEYLDSFISIKIFAKDENDNSLEWTMEPAFSVGDAITKLDSQNNEGTLMPKEVILHQNYPNPFNPQTQIRFEIPEKQKVRLEIYDVSGKLIKTLIDKKFESGYHSLTWDGTDDRDKEAPSGVYFCKISTTNFNQVKPIVLIR